MRLARVGFHLLVIATLANALFVLFRNLWILKRLEDELPPEPNDNPFVSVLIPARNEERSLSKCLESLSQQTYPRYSITVLDDNSTDQTAEIVRAFARRHENIELISGEPLPEGWAGKPWACAQLAEQATGDLYLFVDADTWFTPDVISRAAGLMQRQRPGLLSVMPHQEAETPGERVVLPGLYMLFLCAMPLWELENPERTEAAAANGQFICMPRNVYHSVGGHRAVFNRIVEDLALARKTKEAGHSVIARTATDSVYCRMYQSNREVVDGFSKNAFVTFDERPERAISGVVGMIVTHIIPPLLLVTGVVRRTSGWSLLAAAIETSLGFVLRGLVSNRTGFRTRDAAFAHVNAVAYVFIVLRSMWWHYAGDGYRWKGRSYQHRGLSD
jgi:chlorobactene glucosyltransferase